MDAAPPVFRHRRVDLKCSHPGYSQCNPSPFRAGACGICFSIFGRLANHEVLQTMRTQVQRLGTRASEGSGSERDRWGQVVALDPDLAGIIGYCSIALLVSLLLTLAVPLSSEAAAMFAQLT